MSGPDLRVRRRVVVIGGGIAGLAAAWTLAELAPGAEIVVLESADRVGGKLRLDELAGHSIDVGAEAMLARRPEAVELVRELGLQDRLIAPLTTSAGIFAGGRLLAMPARTMMGIPGDLETLAKSEVLTGEGLARVRTEPASAPLEPLAEDVAVGQLVRQRLGAEVLDRLVEPLLGGVYAGLADHLSLAATMPALAARLRSTGGSLVEAAGAVVDGGARTQSSEPVFVSTSAGVGHLPVALVGSGRFEVRTGRTVTGLRRDANGFMLDVGDRRDGEQIGADAVIVAAPAAKAAGLLGELAPAAAGELAGIESASMAIVSFAYSSIALPAGSGLLVGYREGLAVKAVTFSSQKWPGTPHGLTLLRSSIGRIGQTQDLQRDDDDLIALVRSELNRLIGIDAAPVESLVTRWGGGLPQYAVGHLERVGRIRAAVAQVPGLAVCGAAYDGVGIPACIASARLAARRVAELVGPGGDGGE